ncbi:hypothetical protein GN956_G25124 [Arapaima gigas]
MKTLNEGLLTEVLHWKLWTLISKYTESQGHFQCEQVEECDITREDQFLFQQHRKRHHQVELWLDALLRG